MEVAVVVTRRSFLVPLAPPPSNMRPRWDDRPAGLGPRCEDRPSGLGGPRGFSGVVRRGDCCRAEDVPPPRAGDCCCRVSLLVVDVAPQAATAVVAFQGSSLLGLLLLPKLALPLVILGDKGRAPGRRGEDDWWAA